MNRLHVTTAQATRMSHNMLCVLQGRTATPAPVLHNGDQQPTTTQPKMISAGLFKTMTCLMQQRERVQQ
jgi:hypothetical protein